MGGAAGVHVLHGHPHHTPWGTPTLKPTRLAARLIPSDTALVRSDHHPITHLTPAQHKLRAVLHPHAWSPHSTE